MGESAVFFYYQYSFRISHSVGINGSRLRHNPKWFKIEKSARNDGNSELKSLGMLLRAGHHRQIRQHLMAMAADGGTGTPGYRAVNGIHCSPGSDKWNTRFGALRSLFCLLNLFSLMWTHSFVFEMLKVRFVIVFPALVNAVNLCRGLSVLPRSTRVLFVWSPQSLVFFSLSLSPEYLLLALPVREQLIPRIHDHPFLSPL